MIDLYIGGAEEKLDAYRLAELEFDSVHLDAKRLIHGVQNFEKSLNGPRLQHIPELNSMFTNVMFEFDEPYDILDMIEEYATLIVYPERYESFFESIAIEKRCPVITKWLPSYENYKNIMTWTHAPVEMRKRIAGVARMHGLKLHGGPGVAKQDLLNFRYASVTSSRWLSARTYGTRAIFFDDWVRVYSRKKNDYGLIRAACDKHGVDYAVVEAVRAGDNTKEAIWEMEKLTLGAYKEWMIKLKQ